MNEVTFNVVDDAGHILASEMCLEDATLFIKSLIFRALDKHEYHRYYGIEIHIKEKVNSASDSQ